MRAFLADVFLLLLISMGQVYGGKQRSDFSLCNAVAAAAAQQWCCIALTVLLKL